MEGEGRPEQDMKVCAQEMTEERELGAAQEWQDAVVVPVEAAYLLAPQACTGLPKRHRRVLSAFILLALITTLCELCSAEL